MAITTDYINGKYSAYVYDNNKLKYGYTKTVAEKKYYENNYGLRIDTAYLILGGDRYYEDWYGRIKNVKFFYDSVITS